MRAWYMVSNTITFAEAFSRFHHKFVWLREDLSTGIYEEVWKKQIIPKAVWLLLRKTIMNSVLKPLKDKKNKTIGTINLFTLHFEI